MRIIRMWEKGENDEHGWWWREWKIPHLLFAILCCTQQYGSTWEFWHVRWRVNITRTRELLNLSTASDSIRSDNDVDKIPYITRNVMKCNIYLINFSAKSSWLRAFTFRTSHSWAFHWVAAGNWVWFSLTIVWTPEKSWNWITFVFSAFFPLRKSYAEQQ